MRRRRSFGTVKTRQGKPGFYVRFRWRGREYLRAAGPTRTVAEKKIVTAHALLESGATVEDVLADVFGDLRGSRLTFRDAVPLYLEHAKTKKRASTWEVDLTRFRVLMEATWSGKYLAEIGTEEIERWKQERLAAGLSVASVNRYLALASALYRWANRLRYCDENPVKRVERLSEIGRERNEYLTPEEVAALIECAAPTLRPVLVATFHTGARINAILSLTWDDVIFERNTIRFRAVADKAGRSREVPMTPALHEALLALHRERRVGGPEQVFLGEQGRPASIHVLREYFKRALAKCDTIPQEKRERIARERVKFHLGRRTAATAMVMAGVPLYDVSKILGNSTLAVTERHYAKFAPASARSAVAKLGMALDTAPATATPVAEGG